MKSLLSGRFRLLSVPSPARWYSEAVRSVIKSSFFFRVFRVFRGRTLLLIWSSLDGVVGEGRTGICVYGSRASLNPVRPGTTLSMLDLKRIWASMTSISECRLKFRGPRHSLNRMWKLPGPGTSDAEISRPVPPKAELIATSSVPVSLLNDSNCGRRADHPHTSSSQNGKNARWHLE